MSDADRRAMERHAAFDPLAATKLEHERALAGDATPTPLRLSLLAQFARLAEVRALQEAARGRFAPCCEGGLEFIGVRHEEVHGYEMRLCAKHAPQVRTLVQHGRYELRRDRICDCGHRATQHRGSLQLLADPAQPMESPAVGPECSYCACFGVTLTSPMADLVTEAHESVDALELVVAGLFTDPAVGLTPAQIMQRVGAARGRAERKRNALRKDVPPPLPNVIEQERRAGRPHPFKLTPEQQRIESERELRGHLDSAAVLARASAMPGFLRDMQRLPEPVPPLANRAAVDMDYIRRTPED